MKKSIIFFLFTMISVGAFPQQIVKESIDSGGGVATATGIKIIHTIGEVVVAEKDNGTLHVSEGFIGAEFANYLDIEDYTTLIGVKAYPNPTADVLYLTFSEPQNYQIQVFDMSGKEVLMKQYINTEKYNLNVTNLQAAAYLILIKNIESKQYKTFKIVKE